MSGKGNRLVLQIVLLMQQNAPTSGRPAGSSLQGLIPRALTPNFAKGCLGLFRVREEREAFLGKEMTPQ